MTDHAEILHEIRDGIATITLNRPERLNAWTARMEAEVAAALRADAADPAVRCIVVTGAGRGFCAGADMGGLQDAARAGKLDGAEARAARAAAAPPMGGPGPSVAAAYPGRFGWIFDIPKPVLMAVNGPCAGIGLVFALYGDLRLTTEDAVFTTAFAARGLVAEHGCAWLLPRLIGEPAAMDLLLTARKLKGAEAARLGLVNRAVPAADFAAEVAETARVLAHEVSPRAVAVMKRQVRLAAHQSFAESLAMADTEMHASFAAPDFAEGVAAFAERRAPAFPAV